MAKMIQLYGLLDAKRALEGGEQAAFRDASKAQVAERGVLITT